jgi:hypothetical protein
MQSEGDTHISAAIESLCSLTRRECSISCCCALRSSSACGSIAFFFSWNSRSSRSKNDPSLASCISSSLTRIFAISSCCLVCISFLVLSKCWLISCSKDCCCRISSFSLRFLSSTRKNEEAGALVTLPGLSLSSTLPACFCACVCQSKAKRGDTVAFHIRPADRVVDRSRKIHR